MNIQLTPLPRGRGDVQLLAPRYPPPTFTRVHPWLEIKLSTLLSVLLGLLFRGCEESLIRALWRAGSDRFITF